MYLLALILPPLAVLFCGKPIQFIINIILCLLFWIPAIIHALLVVNERKSDKRMAKMAKIVLQKS